MVNKTFQLALQIAQKIEDASYRSWALRGIAEAMAEAGQTEQANKTFQLALQTAQKIEDARSRSFALSDIAEAMAKVGQTEQAKKPFNSPSKSPRKLKTQGIVLRRSVRSPL